MKAVPLQPQSRMSSPSLGQWLSTRGNFGPLGTFGNVWEHLGLSHWGEVLLLASNREEQGC